MQHDTTTPPPAVARALISAHEHVRSGRGDSAELLYRQVLDAEPHNAEAREGLDELRRAAAPAPRRSLARRAARRYGRPALESIMTQPRMWKYQLLSSCPNVSGRPNALQPVLFVGPGAIALGEAVQLGWKRSPLFYTGYCHIEAATADARIEIGDRVEINNNAFIKSEGPGITIGRDGLIGAFFQVFDSNFHDLDPLHRQAGTPRKAPVRIAENVFIGMNVTILKGVTIGADSVIGAGSVVAGSIPAGVVAAGNPARVVREL
jgi:acetyltransferase-like isoleucine patch superfamily enzyme